MFWFASIWHYSTYYGQSCWIIHFDLFHFILRFESPLFFHFWIQTLKIWFGHELNHKSAICPSLLPKQPEKTFSCLRQALNPELFSTESSTLPPEPSRQLLVHFFFYFMKVIMAWVKQILGDKEGGVRKSLNLCDVIFTYFIKLW